MTIFLVYNNSILVFEEPEHQMFDYSILKGGTHGSTYFNDKLDHPLIGSLPNVYASCKKLDLTSVRPHRINHVAATDNYSSYRKMDDVRVSSRNMSSNLSSFLGEAMFVSSARRVSASNSKGSIPTQPNFAALNLPKRPLVGEAIVRSGFFSIANQSTFEPFGDMNEPMRDDQDPGGLPVGPPIPLSDGLGLFSIMALGFMVVKWMLHHRLFNLS